MNTVWPQPPTLADMAFVATLARWVQHGPEGVGDTCPHDTPSVVSFGTEAAMWRSTLYADGCVESYMRTSAVILAVNRPHDAYPEGMVE